MADAIHVKAPDLMQAATTVAEHLETAAVSPSAVAPTHAAASPVDVATAGAAVAIETKMSALSTEMAPRGPAIRQAGSAAAAALLAQDAANSARMPSVPNAFPSMPTNAAQSLAYTSPQPPRPVMPSQSAPIHQLNPAGPVGQPPPPLTSPGTPPPPPPQSAPPAAPPQPLGPPTAPQTGAPLPGAAVSGLSTGSGLAGSPLAPPVPLPPPEPSSPGSGPVQRPDVSSWARPPAAPSTEAALSQLSDLITKINHHNQNPPNTADGFAVAAYNSEADFLNAWAAQLHNQLDAANTPHTPASTANRVDVSGWTQPAPRTQPPHTPAPPAPTSPSITDQATQIGKDVGENVPKGSRLNTLVDRLSQLHIDSQQQAAQAAQAAGEAAWGATGGIVDGPNGAKLVLPADLRFQQAILVAPDGTLSVFRGNLYPFLPK